MVKYDFKMTLTNNYVFVKKYDSSDVIILLLYVNDKIIVGHKTFPLKKAMSKSLAMKNLGSAKNTLEMKITGDRPKKLF